MRRQLKQINLLRLLPRCRKTFAPVYKYPFAVEREEFIRHFYDYVCAVKRGFNKSWTAWVAQTLESSEGQGAQ